jgi:hypothetical protein
MPYIGISSIADPESKETSFCEALAVWRYCFDFGFDGSSSDANLQHGY